eukprot:COSAG04_NODE_267_length_18528_cov_60.607141_3_plen_115_part_00
MRFVVAGVQPLAEEPAADAKHSHYLPQREEWGKLEGQIEQHPAKRDQHWVGEKELQRHWTTDAAMAAQVLERPIHHTQHSSAQSQADGGEGDEVVEAGGSVYDGGLQFEPAKLS